MVMWVPGEAIGPVYGSVACGLRQPGSRAWLTSRYA
jgi:hypothetical protein